MSVSSVVPSRWIPAGPIAWSAASWISTPRPFASTRCADGNRIISRSYVRCPTSFREDAFAGDREGMTPPSNRVFSDREVLTPGRSGKMWGAWSFWGEVRRSLRVAKGHPRGKREGRLRGGSGDERQASGGSRPDLHRKAWRHAVGNSGADGRGRWPGEGEDHD